MIMVTKRVIEGYNCITPRKLKSKMFNIQLATGNLDKIYVDKELDTSEIKDVLEAMSSKVVIEYI